MVTINCGSIFGLPVGLEEDKQYLISFNRHDFAKLIINEEEYILIDVKVNNGESQLATVKLSKLNSEEPK